MVKHNPAYRDPSYVAVATPIPGEGLNGASGAVQRPSDAVQESGDRPRRAAAAAATQQPVQPTPKLSRSVGRQSATSDQADDDPDFTGKTFQQAQDQIIRKMMTYTEEG